MRNGRYDCEEERNGFAPEKNAGEEEEEESKAENLEREEEKRSLERESSEEEDDGEALNMASISRVSKKLLESRERKCGEREREREAASAKWCVGRGAT